jgi:hypothetical protein
MSTKAQAILEEIQALPPTEQREVSHLILKQLVTVQPVSRHRTISDIASKYHVPQPERDCL